MGSHMNNIETNYTDDAVYDNGNYDHDLEENFKEEATAEHSTHHPYENVINEDEPARQHKLEKDTVAKKPYSGHRDNSEKRKHLTNDDDFELEVRYLDHNS